MAEAFLAPIKDNPNFYLSLKSEVIKLNMNPRDPNRVKTVTVNVRGKVMDIRVRKEVILTAGAINNAKILLLSGIGPKCDLARRNVTVVKHLPGVGKNLQMHLNVPVFVGIKKCKDGQEDNIEDCELDAYKQHDFFRDIFYYVIHREGNLANIDINDIVVYMYTKRGGGIFPNVGIYHNYFKINDTKFQNVLNTFQFTPSIDRCLRYLNRGRSVVLFSISLLRPDSKGEVSLNNKDIYANPKITPHFLTAGEDMDTLTTAFKLVKNMIENNEINTLNASVLNIDIPNCRHLAPGSVKYARCYIINMAYPIPDVAGTAKMSMPCDNNMVVNKVLEVRGIRCVRVGDSSILPNITIGSSVATDIMLGFRLAEILKGKWLKHYSSNYTIDTQTGV